MYHAKQALTGAGPAARHDSRDDIPPACKLSREMGITFNLKAARLTSDDGMMASC